MLIRRSRFSFSSSAQCPAVNWATALRVYGVAKTVADCFKHRNKIGLAIAIEALKVALAQRKATADELWRFAKICRVAIVMRPYLEALGHGG